MSRPSSPSARASLLVAIAFTLAPGPVLSDDPNTPPADSPRTEAAQPAPAQPVELKLPKTFNPLLELGFLVPPPPPSDPSWLNDPFKAVEREMAIVVSDLHNGDTSRPVQVEQPQLIERMDAIIAILEKQKKGGGSGPANSPNPTGGADKSSLAGGPGGQGEMRSPANSRREWAKLTPKEREKILQSKTQDFPAGFEELLEDYFIRLAREQGPVTPETTDDSK